MMSKNTVLIPERWIDGFRFTGRRRLSSEEFSVLQQRLKRAQSSGNCTILAICSIISFIFFEAAILGTVDPKLIGPLLSVTIILFSIMLLQARQQLRIYRETILDIQEDEVEIYCTPAGTSPFTGIGLLPRSQRLFVKDYQFVSANVYLRVHSIAPTPEPMAKEFPIQYVLEGNRFCPVRTLSAEEKLELGSLLPKRTTWKWLVPVLLWSWSLIGYANLVENGYSSANLARVSIVAIAAASMTAYYRVRARRLSIVEADLRQGTVVCERSEGYVFEHLEHSALLWTIDRRPASWRKRSLSSWFCPTI